MFLSLVVVTILIGVLHFVTPGFRIFFHDAYRRLSYFPIAIGAILFGIRGGLFLALLSSLSYIPHLYLFWARGPEAYYSEFSEILFYFAAGIVIGLISSREKVLRKKYQELSEKLKISYLRLHSQAETLVEAEKQLGKSRQMSALGHVSASLAHEIKNPLASIRGAAEILADEVPEEHPKFEFVRIIKSEISRLNQSVEKVLEYCRGAKDSDPSTDGAGEKSAIKDIIQKAVELLNPQISGKKIKVTVNIDTTAAQLPVDEAGMHQVMMNLLVNAVDAVSPGGQIDISGTVETSEYRILVCDNGPGIDKETADRIFNPFVTFKEGGTGLGLSISSKIIKRLGGTVELEESPLGGAAFLIKLPVTMEKV